MNPFFAWLKYCNEKQLFEELLSDKIGLLNISKNTGTQKILDVGCGSGETSARILNVLEKQDIHFEYTALDPYQKNIDAFKIKMEERGVSDIKYVLSPFEKFEASENAYDLLVACQVLYYFNDIKSMIEKMLDMAKETIIVHHGSNGIHTFHQKFLPHVRMTDHIMSTYSEVQTMLDEINSDGKYKIQFFKFVCQVDIEQCKDENSEDGNNLLTFFLGKDISEIPVDIRKEIHQYFKDNYNHYKVTRMV
jgi:SAM-dependent methyltransferase